MGGLGEAANFGKYDGEKTTNIMENMLFIRWFAHPPHTERSGGGEENFWGMETMLEESGVGEGAWIRFLDWFAHTHTLLPEIVFINVEGEICAGGETTLVGVGLSVGSVCGWSRRRSLCKPKQLSHQSEVRG